MREFAFDAEFQFGLRLALSWIAEVLIGVSVDGVIIRMELGNLRFTRTYHLPDYPRLRSKTGVQSGGALWRWTCWRCSIGFSIGGGNEIYLGNLPSRCRLIHNEDAYLGAVRLWDDGEVTAVSLGSSWRFERSAERLV